MKKHILFVASITLVATILFTTMFFVNAETNKRDLYYNDDFIYEILPDNTITIHYYIGSASQVTVPSYIDSVPVVSVEALAFYDTSIKNVYISEGITTLKDEAFFYSYGLETVTLPSTLKTVGQGVFRDCVKLKSVTFSGNTATLGKYMFYGCTRLEEVNLPDSITHIPTGMFSYCQNLKQITLPESLDTIYDYAFYNCGLEAIELPLKLQNIHKKAFAESRNLADIICADTEYTYVSEDAFYNCKAKFPGFKPEETTTHQSKPDVTSSAPAYTTEPTATSGIVTNPSEPTTTSSITTDPPEPSVSDTFPKPPSIDVIPPEDTSGEGVCGSFSSEETSTPVSTEPSAAYTDPTESTLPPEKPTENTTIPITASTPPLESSTASTSTQPSKPKDYITDEGYYIGETEGFLLYESSKISSAKDTVNNNRDELLALAWNVRTLGDVNNDDKVNVKDATQIQRFIALIIDESSPDFNYKNADVNTDGKITVRDATTIQKFVAKLIDSLY